MVEKIFEVSYNIWNTLVGVAMTLFVTSPTSASGSVYAIAKTCFDAIYAISVPIAVVFFLIAIIKYVMATPPEQQARRFIQSALKFAVLVGVLANLWLFMGYIMQIADGVTDSIGVSGDYTVSMSSDLQTAIDEVQNPTYTNNLDFFDLSNTIGPWIDERKDNLLQNVVLLLGAVGTLVMTLAAGLSIINCAFQRIIKPLVILPFSTITVAMAAGSNEAERIATSYLKTFFGLCLSGAFMVVSVKLGAALISGGLIAFNTASTDLWERIIYNVVQNAITPTVIAGLVKSADSTISRFF